MYSLDDIAKGKKRNIFSLQRELKFQQRYLSSQDIEEMVEKLKDALEVSQYVIEKQVLHLSLMTQQVQTFGKEMTADLKTLHSRLAEELQRRQQAQVRPLSPISYTLENIPSTLGGEGYVSDPSSLTSCHDSLIEFQDNPQLIDLQILRVETLEKKIIEFEQHVEVLQEKNVEYEQKNVANEQKIETLEKKNVEYEHRIEQLEASNASLRSSLDDQSKQLEATKVALENQIEAAMQAIRNVSGGGQALPGQSSSALEPRVESLSGKVDELQAQLDDIGKSPPQPQETPFQYWKTKACTILGISRQGDTTTVPFGCFDEECNWQNRTLTLNAYIQHLKRNHGINLIDMEVPDLEYLPKVSDE